VPLKKPCISRSGPTALYTPISQPVVKSYYPFQNSINHFFPLYSKLIGSQSIIIPQGAATSSEE